MKHNKKPESIASHVAKTFESFQDLETALTKATSSDEPSEGATLKSLLPVIENDFTRFKMWAGNQAAHQIGPSSLDHRLREAPHLQQQVIYLLKDMCESLEDALSQVCESSEPQDQEKGNDQNIQDIGASSIDSAQGQESDFSDSDSDFDDDAPTTVLSTLLLDAREATDCLLRLSVAIANPAPHERFRKLGAGSSKDISFYEPYDIAYVRDKFPKSTDELSKALGKFITRRRQFFKYRLTHHEKLASGIETLASNKETDTGHTEVVPKTIASSLPDEFKALAKFDPQVAVIDEDIRSDTGISQTSYATSAGFNFEGTDQETHKPAPPLRVPPKPSAAEDGIFECPFCYRMTSARTRRAWKRHVFGDLRPYTCILSHCTESNADFDRRHNWQLHVSKYHWRSWSCPFKCHQPFSSAVDLGSHIKDQHLPTGDEEEIKSVTAFGEKPAPDDTASRCLLCGHSIMGLKKYVKHLGRHLEQLALFALPSLETEDLEIEMGSNERNSVKSRTDANSLYGSSTSPSAILTPKQKPVTDLAVGEEEDEEDKIGSYEYESPEDLHDLSEKAWGKLPATHNFGESTTQKHTESPSAQEFENESRTGTGSRVGPPLPSHEVSLGDSESDKSRDKKLSKDLSEARTDPKGAMDLRNQADHGSDSGRGHLQQTWVPQEMAILSQENRNEVTELAKEMLNDTSEQEKASTLAELQSQVSPAELAEATYQGTDLLMRRHELTHSRELLFCPVPECRKTYLRKDLLERHVSTHDNQGMQIVGFPLLHDAIPATGLQPSAPPTTQPSTNGLNCWTCCNCDHGFWNPKTDIVCPNCCVPRCPRCSVS
ncbi:unnamed protein product [Fusarium graminearum]|nr:unnamed protein product [Fusarium graminearum]